MLNKYLRVWMKIIALEGKSRFFDSISNVLVTLPGDILNSKIPIKSLPCMYTGNNSSVQHSPGKICHQSSPSSFPTCQLSFHLSQPVIWSLINWIMLRCCKGFTIFHLEFCYFSSINQQPPNVFNLPFTQIGFPSASMRLIPFKHS